MSRLLGARADRAPFRILQLALVPRDRATLHRRIETRFDRMLADGLVAELEALRARYALDPGLPSMRCVGYRQAWEHLEGRYDRAGLRDRGIFATRQLAKRQLTWLRSTSDLVALDGLAPDLESRAAQVVGRAL
jgi:tRNA dimethylallyltransferase